MNVERDRVVSIAYTLKNDAGQIIDSSEHNGDLSYLHGHDNIVEGLETALEGKSIGESVETTVEPEQGYGVRDESLLFAVERSKMPDEELELGMQFAAQDKSGNQHVMTLVEIGDDMVKLDGNHPLAGERLHFDVQVADVRDAEAVEIEHGHVHDPNHDDHHNE